MIQGNKILEETVKVGEPHKSVASFYLSRENLFKMPLVTKRE